MKQLIEQIVKEELQRLDEKLITFGSRANYGQIVFIAGGAGSGKGFAISNFLDSANFKVRDVDEWKKSFLKLAKLKEKYSELRGLDLKNPKDVGRLHMFVKQKDIEDKTINLMLSQAKEGRLPNIIFDVTMKDVSRLNKYIPELLEVGYKPENIHLIWVLTKYHVAVKRNQSRERIVPDDILLQTHEGAASTMYDILMKGSSKLPNGLNGRIDVILNNAENTVFFTDEKGNPIEVSPDYEGSKLVVKDFLSLPIKKEGGGFVDNNKWKKTLYSWMKDNIPKTAKSQIF